jgi:hypothetical protein
VNASAADMSAWLRFQLGDGTANGARLVGANVLAAQQAPNTLVPSNVTMPAAVLGPGRVTMQAGETTLLLEAGGERVEFTRVR